MSEAFRIGVYSLQSDAALGSDVTLGLRAAHPIEVDQVLLDASYAVAVQPPFDWVVLVARKEWISEALDRLFMFEGRSFSRERYSVITDLGYEDLGRLSDARLDYAQLTSLSGWKGANLDQAFREIGRVVLQHRWTKETNTQRIERAIFYNILIRSNSGEVSFNPALFLNVNDLDFLPRTKAIFRADNIIYLGDAIQKTQAEWLRTPNFGRKSLDDVNTVLRYYRLAIGSDIPGWPPDNIEEMARRAEAAWRATELRQAPLGATFETASDFLVINPTGSRSDREAAKQPAVQQMHTEIVRKARQFGSIAPRLDNQVGWQGISGLCERLVTLLDRSSEAIPDVVGSLYSSALELGSFFEMDRTIVRGAASYAAPLDAEVRRPLEDLLRSLAPWLRSFPTIREMDDEAGQFLAPPPFLEPSAEVIRTADQTQLINESDAALLRGLLDAASRGEFQGAKAGHRGVLSARNMVVATVGLIGGLILGDFGAKSVLIGKAGTFLAEAETAIVELVSDLPTDLRLAIETIIRENRKAPMLPPAEPRPTRTQSVQPGRRRIAGMLIQVNNGWHLRLEGGGVPIPMISSVFSTDSLDRLQTYRVNGRLLMDGESVVGFAGDEVFVSGAGRA